MCRKIQSQKQESVIPFTGTYTREFVPFLMLVSILFGTLKMFSADTLSFPFVLPAQKPERPLSQAMHRLYDRYAATRAEENELFSNFKYTRLEGFDYNGHDGTISRRDPSKIISVKDKYYIWYTYRKTLKPPKGSGKGDELNPSSDWNLAEIWYTTSEDGFT